MTEKTKSSKEEMDSIRKTFSKLGKNNRCILYAKVLKINFYILNKNQIKKLSSKNKKKFLL
jgi:hypothetical protein